MQTALNPNPTTGVNAGFNLGDDLLGKVMGAWITYNQADIAFDLQRAEIQQKRMFDAVNTDQQIDNYLYGNQGRKDGQEGGGAGALVVAAVLAGLFLWAGK